MIQMSYFRSGYKIKRTYSLLILCGLLLSWSCTSKIIDRSPHIQGVDTHFQNRRFAQALDVIRPRTQNSKDKDRLLYLMEVGTILHTLRDWAKSNLAFIEADEMAESIRKSRGKEILAFLVNQNKQNFVGENFERVKIKFYIALNYLMLGERGKALAYIRALNQELSDIRFEGYDYKQNFAARYLGAILAEEEKEYNFSRIQYNNMLAAGSYIDLAERSLYRLAILEKDQEAMKRYKTRKDELIAYDTNMNRFPLPLAVEETGSLVLLHESGIAPHKVPKGKIKDDSFFQSAFQAALVVAIATDGKEGFDETVLLYFVGESQNPIPVYKKRVNKNLVTQPEVFVAGTPFIPDIFDDYQSTVFQNYNDKYQDYVNYNIANIATRVLAVYLTGKAVEKANKHNEQGTFLGLLVNIIGGGTIQFLLKPDLRAWNLTYNNLQMKRIFLKPGEYHLKVNKGKFNFLSKFPEKVIIEPGKSTFVLFKSF